MAAPLVVAPTTFPIAPAGAAVGDGPATCSTGTPPSPYKGYCGTYNGRNGWYGTYGLGFPGTLGWVLCVNDPSHPGSYPHPNYSYVAGSAPSGMNATRAPAVGFAFSEAQARGWVTNGVPGQFTANQLGAAMRILTLNRFWNQPLPTMDAGLTRAYTALDALVTAAIGATATPQLTLSIAGDPTIATSATVNGLLSFPGSGTALSGTSVTLSVSGGTFSTPGGPSTTTVTTSSTGRFSAVVVNAGGPAHPITISATGTVGQRGLTYLVPTLYVPDAQVVAAANGPTRIATSLTVDAGPQTGAIAISKHVDDPAWVGPGGAEFTILDSGGNVVGALTTAADGTAGPTDQLPVGTYTVTEATPPWGYEPAPDQTVTVTSGAVSTVTYDGATIEQVIRADLGLRKVDADTGRGVTGATFSIAYDASNTGVFDTLIGTCVTLSNGDCGLNDLATLLPGDYEITEVSAPPGYHLPSPNQEIVRLIPGEVRTITFRDAPITTTITVHKANSTQPGTGVPGAVYDLYAVDPGPAGGVPEHPPTDAAVLAQLSWYDRGTTDDAGHLHFTVPVGSAWCVLEHSSPPGFTLDPALRCTSGVVEHAPRTIAVAEVPHEVTLAVHKYNAVQPGTGIPHAVYDLFVTTPFPTGFAPPAPPSGVAIPSGMAFFASGVTGNSGDLHFTLPSGYHWCVRERTAPADYVLDPALHCTAGVLTTSSAQHPTVVAVPERHTPELPYTGANTDGTIALGAAMTLLGMALLALRRRRGTAAVPMLRQSPTEE